MKHLLICMLMFGALGTAGAETTIKKDPWGRDVVRDSKGKVRMTCRVDPWGVKVCRDPDGKIVLRCRTDSFGVERCK